MMRNSRKTSSAQSVHRIGAREAFLSCFSARHRQEVVEFGKRLRDVDADYLLFMARKAVCFYECLATLKLTELRGVLVSDRILDMDLSWLKGKRVAIIDDAVIYGSTLAKVAARLKAAGAVVSSTIVYCVNMNSWKRELVEPSEPFLRLNESETTGFCADLVRAISVLPMPYAVDYPVVRRIRIADQDLPQLLCLPGWAIKAHTSPLQHSFAVSTMVCTPSQSRLRQMFSEAELSMAGVAILMKIRLYGRRIDKHAATWFTSMPVVVFDPLSNTHVDALWNCVLKGSNADDLPAITKSFSTHSSRLRAIQFILAARIASHWLRDVNALLGTRIAPRIDATFAGFTFTPSTARLLSAIAARGIDFSSAGSVKRAHVGLLRLEKPIDTFDHNPWSLQAALIKPFLDLHVQKEVPARQQSLPLSELPDPVLKRLEEGFSLPQLRQCVSSVSGRSPSFEVLSEFLDYAIDRGFIVPITSHHNEVVYRAYRYGEDIRDAEQFRQLCAHCAQSFLEASGLPAISRTWLEKLLVMLLQGLLDNSQINPTDLAMGSSGTLGVRYALHGAVLKESAPRIYSHYEGRFYVDVLVKYGYFRRHELIEPPPHTPGSSQSLLPEPARQDSKEHARYYTPSGSHDPIPEAHRAQEVSESIGLLFGSLTTPLPNAQSLSVDDITLIATCNSPTSTSAAIAAELDIFIETWRFTQHQMQRGNTAISSSSLRSERWFIALNSARYKFRDYLRDVSDTRLESIESSLVAAGSREWKFVLSGLRSFRRTRLARLKYSRSDPRYGLMLELGRLAYELNLLSRLLILGNENFSNGISANSISAELKELQAEHTSLLRGATSSPQPQHKIRIALLKSIARAEAPDLNTPALKTWALQQIVQAEAHVSEYLQRVDHLVSRVGIPNQFDLFPHVLVAELKSIRRSASNSNTIDRTVTSAIREFNSNPQRGRAYGHIFSSEDTSQGMIAIGFRGDSSRNLLELVLQRLSAFGSPPVVNRVFAVFDIPREEQPLKSECSPKCVSGLFWLRVEAIAAHPLVQEPGQYRLEMSEDYIPFNATPAEAPASTGTPLCISSPTEKTIGLHYTAFEREAQSGNVAQRKFKRRRADVGILCVTASELRAIKDGMLESPDYLEEAKFEYFSSTLPGDGCTHRILMTFCTDQGNVSSALAVEKFLTKYKPRLLVVLGMAGSIHDDVGLLDVVISSQIIYYEPRKERDNRVSSRLQTMPISVPLKRAITSLLADSGAPKATIAYSQSGQRHSFGFVEAPIGTGEAVVGTKNSVVRAIVQQCNDKAAIVETEAWGAHRAIYEHQTCKHVLTIKGAADCADEEKDDARQYRATRNAFETLKALLRTLAVDDLA